MKKSFESWEPNFSLDVVASEQDATWELLSLYVDGETTPEESAHIESLLAIDPDLARDFAFLQTTHQSLFTLNEVSPPSSLRDAILASTSQRLTLRRRLAMAWAKTGRRWARYAMPVGSIMATAMLTFLVLQHREQQDILTGEPTPSQISVADVPKPSVNKSQPNPTITPSNPTLKPSVPSVGSQRPANQQVASLPKTDPVEITGSEVDSRIARLASNRFETPSASNQVFTGLRNSQKHPTIIASNPQKLPIQNPKSLAVVNHKETPMVVEYSPQPMMDTENQRPTPRATTAMLDLNDVKSSEEGSTTASAISVSDTSEKEKRAARILRSRTYIMSSRVEDENNNPVAINNGDMKRYQMLRENQNASLFTRHF